MNQKVLSTGKHSEITVIEAQIRMSGERGVFDMGLRRFVRSRESISAKVVVGRYHFSVERAAMGITL